ncbi:Ras-related protein Rab5 [Tritrichomonas foetus]|uniref:Ras-related protein Rab5 n=1 Tax=Tritrichomonas foetus TaxID=1144522 RepID=A0A1J4JWI8_9EUKA|nr:Ras-related protein Rab5 [Tritrichomonas foetus]|eukprot:OHT01900.1 Ras-related protein Rab5 [Tritrichomonas foetus]
MKGSLNTSLGRVTLEVWDTAGQEQFTSLAPVFFSNASAAILVYDLTERNSLYAIERYLSMISDRASENCIICLVGNKKDLVENDSSKREVSPEESIRFGSKIGAKYILEVSALSGENINDIFLSIANDPDLVGASSQEESIIKPETNKGGKSCC